MYHVNSMYHVNNSNYTVGQLILEKIAGDVTLAKLQQDAERAKQKTKAAKANLKAATKQPKQDLATVKHHGTRMSDGFRMQGRSSLYGTPAGAIPGAAVPAVLLGWHHSGRKLPERAKARMDEAVKRLGKKHPAVRASEREFSASTNNSKTDRRADKVVHKYNKLKANQYHLKAHKLKEKMKTRAGQKKGLGVSAPKTAFTAGLLGPLFPRVQAKRYLKTDARAKNVARKALKSMGK